MTNLRALVGACFLLAVTGIIVFVPLGWAIVLGIGEAYPEKIIKGLPYQRNDVLMQIAKTVDGRYQGADYFSLP